MQLQFLEGSPKAGISHGWCGGRRLSSRAGLPCCTIRGRGHDSLLLSGRAANCEAGCAARGAQGCPSEQGPCTPGGCVLGQGLCHLPGSALSLPGELPTVLWGEAVAARGDSQQEAKTVLHGSGLLTAPGYRHDIDRESFGRRTSRQHFPEREAVCALTFLLLGDPISGEWEFLSVFWRRHGDPCSH